MLIHALRAPVFATNTLVLAPREAGPAVVVDPGAGTAPLLDAVLARRGLHVAAVLLTHGHPDHVWDCAAVAPGAPVHVGADDIEWLRDPGGLLGPALGPMFASLVDTPWRAPAQVTPLPAGPVEPVPGLVLEVIPAPGHTAGSTLFQLTGCDELVGPVFAEAGVSDHGGPVVLTGDVLFAGSIGRTDLPGGDERRMAATLRDLAARLPHDALLVPGHGPATTMARELATNPFLARVQG